MSVLGKIPGKVERTVAAIVRGPQQALLGKAEEGLANPKEEVNQLGQSYFESMAPAPQDSSFSESRTFEDKTVVDTNEKGWEKALQEARQLGGLDIQESSKIINVPKARGILCGLILNGDLDFEARNKVLDSLIELLREKSYGKKAAEGLVIVAASMQKKINEPLFFDDIHVESQMKIVLAFGLAMRVNNHHVLMGSKNAVHQEFKSGLIETDKTVSSLNVIKDPHLDFAIQFAIESHKRIKDNSSSIKEALIRGSHILAAISALYNKQLGEMVGHFKNALDKIDHHITHSWYDHFLLLDVLSQLARKDLTELKGFLKRAEVSLAACDDWKLAVGYLLLLKEIVLKSPDPEVRKNALFGWKDQETQTDKKGKGKLAEQPIYFLGLLDYLACQSYKNDSVKIRFHCAEYLADITRAKIDENIVSEVKQAFLIRLPAENDLDIQSILGGQIEEEIQETNKAENEKQALMQRVFKGLPNVEGQKNSPKPFKRKKIPSGMSTKSVLSEGKEQSQVPSFSDLKKIDSEKQGTSFASSFHNILKNFSVSAAGVSEIGDFSQSTDRSNDSAFLFSPRDETSSNGVIQTASSGQDELSDNIDFSEDVESFVLEDDDTVVLEEGKTILQSKDEDFFLELIKIGEEDKIKQWIEHQSKDVNALVDRFGRSLLYIAIEQKNLNIVALLLEIGANVHAVDKEGDTPLHHAAREGSQKMCDLLIKKGAKIYATNNKGCTPLHRAAVRVNPGTITWLINHGANVNAVNHEGDTPLHHAASMAHPDNVIMLINHGADVNAANHDGDTPLHLIAQRISSHILARGSMIRRGGISLADSSLEIVNQLISKGAKTNAENKIGATPLHAIAGGEGRRATVCKPPLQDDEVEAISKIINSLLKHGADVNDCDHDGRTPLLCAVVTERLEIIRLLLTKGANINAPNSNRNTFRFFDAIKGNPKIIALLLENGSDESSESVNILITKIANVNAITKDKNTLLHYAVNEGDRETIAQLIEKGAEMNARNRDGITPLHIAAFRGNRELVALLIENGGEVNAQGSDGITPLHYAAREGNLEIVAQLVEKRAKVNARASDGTTPLYYATLVESPKVVVKLIEEGADVNARDSHERNALHYAALVENPKVVAKLIEKGTDVNARDSDRTTPLHLAVQKGSLAIAALLLEKGADVDARDSDGTTPLHVAAQEGSLAIVALLLGKGAKIDAATMRGYTPLHDAVDSENSEMVVLLIEKGAKVDAQGSDGRTPLHIAAMKISPTMSTLFNAFLGNPKIIDLLINNGANVDIHDSDGTTPLHIAAYEGSSEVVDRLLGKGADVNAVDKEGFTPLHLAASRENPELVDLLVEKGAKVDARNHAESTPLLLAAYEGSSEVIDRLLGKGADVNAVNKEGFAPLHLAAWRENPTFVEQLIEKGADVDAVDEEGYTPLHFAAIIGAKKTVKVLLKNQAKVNVTSKNGETPFHAATEGKMDRSFKDLMKIFSAAHPNSRSNDIRKARLKIEIGLLLLQYEADAQKDLVLSKQFLKA